MNDKMNEKNNGKRMSYEAPMVELMDARVERGFAGSGVAVDHGQIEGIAYDDAIFF